MPAPTTPGGVLIGNLTADGTKIVAHLAKGITGDSDTPLDLTHFVESDFPGYQSFQLTDWEDVSADDTTIAEVLSAVLQWQPSGLVTPQECVAVYISVQVGVNAATLYDADIFDTPFVFQSDNTTLMRQVRVAEDYTADS